MFKWPDGHQLNAQIHVFYIFDVVDLFLFFKKCYMTFTGIYDGRIDGQSDSVDYYDCLSCLGSVTLLLKCYLCDHTVHCVGRICQFDLLVIIYLVNHLYRVSHQPP